MNLDFSFLDWGVVSSFVAKGFFFSIQLTLIAMIGGIVLGTLLALMRLSSKPWLVWPAAFYVNTLRSIPLVVVILWFFLACLRFSPECLTASCLLIAMPQPWMGQLQ